MGSESSKTTKLVLLTATTLVAFAGNSLLCRAALDVEGMDASSFTLVRLVSGAVTLLALLALRGRVRATLSLGSGASGTWASAVTLVAYALLFSLAYRSIPAGVGALVLFAAVQFTMLAAAVRAGTGPRGSGWLGVALALVGLATLTLPGATAPDVVGVLMMSGSGVAWGIYSLRGRGSKDATHATESTAANFAYACVIAVPACFVLAQWTPTSIGARGAGLALLSGAVTSGLGYVLWYTILPALGTTRAAVLQLSVPVIATLAGAAFLSERLTPRLVIASAAILGGIALVIGSGRSVARGATRPGARSAGVGAKLGASVMVTALLLFACEGAVRLRQYLRHGTFERVHVFAPENGDSLRLPRAGRDTGAIRINSRSFRGPEIDDPKPAGRIRLAFLGGSTTFCAEASSNAATWPALVTSALAERFPDIEFDHVNAGVPGYTTETSMENLVRRVLPLEPDVIFVYHATNDIAWDTRLRAKEQGIYDESMDRDSWLARASLAWYLIEKNLAFKSRSGGAGDVSQKVELDSGLTDRFGAQLAELIDSAQGVAELVVVPTFSLRARRGQTVEEQRAALKSTFFYMPYMTVASTLDTFDSYNAVIRDVASAHGALLVEAAENIPADDEHFADSVHLTDAGSTALARVVLDGLLAEPRFLELIAE